MTTSFLFVDKKSGGSKISVVHACGIIANSLVSCTGCIAVLRLKDVAMRQSTVLVLYKLKSFIIKLSWLHAEQVTSCNKYH